MKILFLSHYYKPEGNAPASRVSALAERWAKNGDEVCVITCAPNVPNGVVYDGYKNSWVQQETINGVNVVRVWTYIAPNKGTARRIANFISYMFSAVWHGIFLEKPDIIIATSPQFFCGWAGVLLHFIRRVPFVLEIRDLWPESLTAVGARIPMFGLISFLEKLMYKSANHIVTVGDGYVEKLTERGVDKGKISVIMNGVDKTLFYPRPKNSELLERNGLSGKFVCSYIGTIGMACGLKSALDAAEILAKKGNDEIRLVFVGDGAQKDSLEAEAKKRNLKNVIFLGRRPKDEIPDWIASSDVNLVYLKKSDLFKTVMPSKIFESAGCGKPVIIGVDGFAKNFVEKMQMGIPVEPENPDELAEALELASRSPEMLAKLGENGLKNVVPNYNRDTQADKYREILQTQIKNKK